MNKKILNEYPLSAVEVAKKYKDLLHQAIDDSYRVGYRLDTKKNGHLKDFDIFITLSSGSSGSDAGSLGYDPVYACVNNKERTVSIGVGERSVTMNFAKFPIRIVDGSDGYTKTHGYLEYTKNYYFYDNHGAEIGSIVADSAALKTFDTMNSVNAIVKILNECKKNNIDMELIYKIWRSELDIEEIWNTICHLVALAMVILFFVWIFTI